MVKSCDAKIGRVRKSPGSIGELIDDSWPFMVMVERGESDGSHKFYSHKC